MSFGRAVLAAFIGSVLAGVFLLAYRVSQETSKSIPASLPEVPAEAKKVYTEVRVKATEAVNKGMDKVRHKEGELDEAVDEDDVAEALDEMI
jgi:hypothetical protein